MLLASTTFLIKHDVPSTSKFARLELANRYPARRRLCGILGCLDLLGVLRRIVQRTLPAESGRQGHPR